MHYGPTAFTRNGLPTIEVLQQGATIGQRSQLSPGDTATIRAMYPAGDPGITSPAPGSVLPDSTVTFIWAANGAPVTQWWLYVGSSPGASGHFNSGSIGTNRSVTAIGLPSDGSQLHVRLWFKEGDGWQFTDSQYTAAAAGTPEITSPAPGSVLLDSAASFVWTANGAPISGYWLYIGSSPGASDHFSSGWLGTRMSAAVAGLPTDGRQLHARLWFREGDDWQFADVQYTAATSGDPAISNPTPGSVLPGSIVTFEWTVNGTSVAGWWLYVGSSPGAAEWFNSGWLGARTFTSWVAGLPTNGRQVHARLWYLLDGGWQSADFQYTAARS